MGIEEGLNEPYRNRKNRRKPSMDLSTLVYGKLPPQAKELEEAVLGACMLEHIGNEAFDLAEEILQPESFYVDAHQRIFRACQRIRKAHGIIDLMTVIVELRKTEELDTIGGPYALTLLTNKVTNTARIEQHARIIQQKYYAREIIRISGDAINDAYEDVTDVFELMDNFATAANKIGEGSNGKEFTNMGDNMVAFYSELDRKAAITTDITGIATGFTELDRMTSGLQEGDLVTLAATTGSGKTIAALNIAVNAAKPYNQTCVAVFLLEIPTIQATNRIVSAETSVAYEKIIRGKLTPHDREKVDNATKYIESLPIFIDDTTGITQAQIKAKVKRLKRKRAKERVQAGLDPNEKWLVIVDYLQLMKPNSYDARQTRDKEIGEMTMGLKNMAKDLKLSVIQLSQLSRKNAERKGFRLFLSDLRESGSIEQDSDIVLFIYKTDNLNDKITRIMEIAKHRNGSLGTFPLRAEFWRQKFVNPDEAAQEAPAPISQPWQRAAEQTKANFDEGFNADEAPFE